MVKTIIIQIMTFATVPSGLRQVHISLETQVPDSRSLSFGAHCVRGSSGGGRHPGTQLSPLVSTP